MSEETSENEVEAEVKEETVGNSLLNSLFAAAETEEQTTKQPNLDPNAPFALTDILNEPIEEQVEPEVEEEPKVESDTKDAERNLEKFDKDLFEGGLPSPQEVEKQPEPEPEPVQEVVREVVREVEAEPEPILTEDQDKRFKLAKFAEENFKEFKGLSGQYLEFFKEQKKFIDEKLIEDPDARFDETDYDYQNFLKRKKPKFSQEDLEKVVELRTMRKAKEEAVNELSPEIEKLKEEQRVLRIEPQVEKLKKQTRDSIKELIPDGMKSIMDKKGADFAYNQNPVEFEIVDKIATFHQGAMFAFHDISSGLKKFDPTNDTHVRLATWLDNLQQTMPDKNGKKFVRRENFGKLTSAEKSKSYTLSDSDVVDMAHQSAKAYINSELNANDEKLRKSGYVKSQAVPNHDVAPSPRQSKPAPRQGHNVVSESQSSEKPNPILSALGL